LVGGEKQVTALSDGDVTTQETVVDVPHIQTECQISRILRAFLLAHTVCEADLRVGATQKPKFYHSFRPALRYMGIYINV